MTKNHIYQLDNALRKVNNKTAKIKIPKFKKISYQGENGTEYEKKRNLFLKYTDFKKLLWNSTDMIKMHINYEYLSQCGLENKNNFIEFTKNHKINDKEWKEKFYLDKKFLL